MVISAETLNKNLNEYINDVKKDIPIEKVFLFGSYAKGNPGEWSDIDVCFFPSQNTTGKAGGLIL